MSTTTPIEAAADRSSLVRDAHQRARAAHAGQIRNASGGMPYIEHPVAVATRLVEQGCGEEVLAAALLHDVVEDTETTVDELRAEFGDRVADLVAALSDEETIEPYVERKAEHRARVAAAGPEALAIYAADKLTNVATLRGAYARQGEAVAAEIKVPLDVRIELWDDDLEMLEAEAPQLACLVELAAELTRLKADRAAAAPPAGT
ncbi:MAG: HD domain-containing protein [Solirubrobacterales bacterium]